MKAVLIGLVPICLTGCFADQQQQQFFHCRLDAIKVYPDENDGPYSRRSDYIEACMGAAGYQIASRNLDGIIVASYCTPGSRERIVMEECYAPTGRLERWARYAEEELRGLSHTGDRE
jgi:hypothetical protein